MGTDPNEEEKTSSNGHRENEDHPGSVQGPGGVTVDEPTDPSLSGTSEDDFGGGDEPAAEDDS